MTSDKSPIELQIKKKGLLATLVLNDDVNSVTKPMIQDLIDKNDVKFGLKKELLNNINILKSALDKKASIKIAEFRRVFCKYEKSIFALYKFASERSALFKLDDLKSAFAKNALFMLAWCKFLL